MADREERPDRSGQPSPQQQSDDPGKVEIVVVRKGEDIPDKKG